MKHFRPKASQWPQQEVTKQKRGAIHGTVACRSRGKCDFFLKETQTSMSVYYKREKKRKGDVEEKPCRHVSVYLVNTKSFIHSFKFPPLHRKHPWRKGNNCIPEPQSAEHGTKCLNIYQDLHCICSIYSGCTELNICGQIIKRRAAYRIVIKYECWVIHSVLKKHFRRVFGRQ